MQKVNVAVIGCGNISSIYLQNLTTRFHNVKHRLNHIEE